MVQANSSGPLRRLRVLELGHFVAAPFATRLLADLGADVIKVEPPTGDPVRQWGEQVEGRSLWWSMHGRNKRSIVVDLKSDDGKAIIRKIAAHCDVVVENFRPGQLAKLGLGDDVLREANPKLIIAHISGYGQDGPYRDRAAFGLIGEAIGGLRYLTNQAGNVDTPPVRVGISIGDSIAGIYAAFGICAALWERDQPGSDGTAKTIDVALTESVLSLMEGMLPEYGKLGKIKQPTGSAIATAAPSNAYPSADGKWILIGANSEPLFGRLSELVGHPEWPSDPRFKSNPDRVANAAVLDAMISEWTSQLDATDILDKLNAADIPNSTVYTAEDCAHDPQYAFRDAILEVEDPMLGAILQAGVFPVIKENPGTIRWTGPAIGQHGDEIMREIEARETAG